MQRGIIWGREVCMQGGPLSYLVYRREFGGDLSLDLLEAYKSGQATVETFLRFAWTMAKTYDESTSPYEDWLREFSPEGFSVADSPVGVIDSAITAELFRLGSPGRASRWLRRRRAALSRWLGRVSKRLGAA